MSKRKIIVHYHLFKNAGTSVDEILKDNFGEFWAEIEGPNNRKLDPEPLLDYIRENPELKAVSSHTAVVSIPETEDIEIIPIFFMRHPLARIRSAYDFEKKQDVQTPGAIKAKEGDFQFYMDWRMSTPTPWQVSNFHAFRLKDFHTFTPAKQTQLFLERALKAIEALPVIGLVEDFDRSMEDFAALIRPTFPEFKTFSVVANTTSNPSMSLAGKLKAFEDKIGTEAYQKLLEINAIDFELYNMVYTSRFGEPFEIDK